MFIYQRKTRLCQPSQMVLLALVAMIGISTSAFLPEATNRTCGTSIVPRDSVDRIVKGELTVKGEFPWIVSLRMRNQHFEHSCGATILNERWILTASHCLMYTYRDRYEVLVGLYKQTDQDDPTVRRYKIAKIVMHEDYLDDKSYRSDIALLKTTKPIDIEGSKGYINTICLPTDTKDPEGLATVTGWGHSYTKGFTRDTLRKVVMPIVDRETCNAAYDEDPWDEFDAIDENMICAGTNGRDSCQGDSGGPMFQTDKNGVSTLIGVVSFGLGCGLKTHPGVYTKVSSYLNWIKNAMKE